MKLSESERQVLLAVWRASRRKAASDRQSLEEIAETEIGTLLDWLDFPSDSFDTAILFDVMYFVDRDKTLAQLKEIIKPNGQMGILFTQWLGPDDSEELLQPDKTVLARSLQKHSLPFETHCFSKEESVHWQQKVEVLKALETEFKAEGNDWLYNFRLGEAENHAKSLVERKRSRYLYHVLLPWNAES